MQITDFIARRYLFAKKSMGVINIISGISAAGIAIGCAALVIILSVYNGFDSIVVRLNDSQTADLLITPVSGKSFSLNSEGFRTLEQDSRVKAFCGIVQENVFLQYGGNHKIAVARGVDSVYQEITSLRDRVVEGDFALSFGEIGQVVAGRGIAYSLGMRTAFLTPLEVYFPSRSQDVNLLNPAANLRKINLFPSGIVSIDQEFDDKYIFLQADALRQLLDYGDDVVTSVELYLNPEALSRKGVATAQMSGFVRKQIGDGFEVRDRRQQNPMLYKLLLYEKIAIYLILLFIIVIVSFNIFSSLSLLIIEKREDMEVLRAMGADRRTVSRIFVHEGWFISLIGIAAGLAVGLAVCWAQQKFGFVKMPGNFLITAYPVVVKWTDIVLTVILVGGIGYAASHLSKRFAL